MLPIFLCVAKQAKKWKSKCLVLYGSNLSLKATSLYVSNKAVAQTVCFDVECFFCWKIFLVMEGKMTMVDDSRQRPATSGDKDGIRTVYLTGPLKGPA